MSKSGLNAALTQVLRDGPGPALVDPGGVTITHEELRELVEEVAGGLRGAGVEPGAGVAAVLENSIETVITFLAIARAGAIAMPVNPQLRAREIGSGFEDLRPSLVLVGADGHAPAEAAAEEAGIPLRRLSSDSRRVLADGPAAAAGDEPDADDPVLLLHTSGTTSRPKAVLLRHRNLAASARSIAAGYALTADDVSYCLMPLFHIHGLVASTLAPLSAGGCVVIPRRVRPGALWQDVGAHRVTWFSAVPTILAKLPGPDGDGPGTLRFARSCSSSLPPTLATAFEDRLAIPLVEAYGMTEASHQMATNPLPPAVRRAGTVGLAAGTEVAVIDPDWRAVAAGTAGEVAVRGPGVIAGYLANPEVNAASFRDGWFRTGDIGRLSTDGYLTLDGRIKELINRGGEKIAPREIDEVLLTHPLVREAVAYGAPDAKWGETVNAAVVVSGETDAAALRAFCADHLAPFKVPRRIHVVAEIPKGPTGKVQRRLLADALGS
jgi:acyl-CoA synthetase (AMP-forming)/AMP-acid ligase II